MQESPQTDRTVIHPQLGPGKLLKTYMGGYEWEILFDSGRRFRLPAREFEADSVTAWQSRATPAGNGVTPRAADAGGAAAGDRASAGCRDADDRAGGRAGEPGSRAGPQHGARRRCAGGDWRLWLRQEPFRRAGGAAGAARKLPGRSRQPGSSRGTARQG